MRGSTAASAAASAVALCMAPASALADFTGLPITANLTLGSVTSDTLVGAPDNHDGFTSGDHIFFIWDGGDRAYTLDWPGGPMKLTLHNDDFPFGDPDVFLYRPSNLNDSGDYGITGSEYDEVTLFDTGPGTYYIVIDTTAGNEGAYTLSVTPTPGAASLFGLGALAATRRRR